MLSKPLGSPMYRNSVGFGVRYGANEEKNTKRGVEMTGKGELWRMKNEEIKLCIYYIYIMYVYMYIMYIHTYYSLN